MENQNKNLRIVHFVHWSRSGITELLRSLEDQNGSNSKGLLLLDQDDDFDNYYSLFHPRKELAWSKRKINAIFDIYKFFKLNEIELVHCHSLTPLILTLIFFRKGVFFSVHSKYDYLYGKTPKCILKRILFKLLAKNRRVSLIAVSNSVATLLHRLNITKLDVWPNALPDTPRLKFDYSFGERIIKVCIISRLSVEKNIDSVIKAVSKFNRVQGSERVFLDIYGSGKLDRKLKDLILHEGAEATIKLRGYTREVDKVLPSYDFFISASVNEAFGLSILQACRAYIPIISTKEGEVAENLWEGGGCVQIEGSDTESINAAIHRAISLEEDQVKEMVWKARHLYVTAYNVGAYIDNAERKYREHEVNGN